MGVDKKWKTTGKDTGKAFGSFGKAMGKTAKVVFTDDSNKKEENGHTELSNAWREMGKNFGEAGKSFGQAVSGTAKKVVKGEESEEQPVVEEEASEVVDK